MGAALQEIAREPEIAKGMFDLLEIQKIVDGEGDITLVPEGSEMLKELLAAPEHGGRRATEQPKK